MIYDVSKRATWEGIPLNTLSCVQATQGHSIHLTENVVSEQLFLIILILAKASDGMQPNMTPLKMAEASYTGEWLYYL